MSANRVQDGEIDDTEISLPATERVYSNLGNGPLIDLLDKNYHRVLDIGCGAGDNAALIKSRAPDCEVLGITHSAAEAEIAKSYFTRIWVIDIEVELPDDLLANSFDVLIFSHVLEHLRRPAEVVARFSRLLCTGGHVVIAVPNVLFYPTRLQFLRGDFQYRASGALDNTHLHFYTYFTADHYLLAESPDLELTHKVVSGNVPLGPLRRYVLPEGWSKGIDQWGIRHWPNLFGNQILIRAVKH